MFLFYFSKVTFIRYISIKHFFQNIFHIMGILSNLSFPHIVLQNPNMHYCFNLKYKDQNN